MKSAESPEGLLFRVAEARDRGAVTRLMSFRHPDQDPAELLKRTDREVALNATDPKYRLFVAELDGEVVGLCRYFHSEGLPKEKLVFPAPHGWYCMGILVDPKLRRQGIARFLFQKRLESFEEKGASVIYSLCAAENLASVRMHLEFGFEELERAPGFLHIAFESSGGILFRRSVP